jgi:hypothetical protein
MEENMMQNEQKKEMLYKGKSFENSEKMHEYMEKHLLSLTTDQEFHEIFSRMEAFIWSHLKRYNLMYTNQELEKLHTELIICFMKNLPKTKVEEKKKNNLNIEKIKNIFQKCEKSVKGINQISL